LVWKADFAVDYEIMLDVVSSSIWSHTLRFSLNAASDEAF
jgi:hypothetical protein